MFRLPQSRFSKSATALSAFACLFAGHLVFAQAPSGSPITYDSQLPYDFTNDDPPTLNTPRGVAVYSDGTVYVADSGLKKVIMITPKNGLVSTEGNYLEATGTALTPKNASNGNITFTEPTAVAIDSTGRLYIADTTGHQVIEMTAPETANTTKTITYGTPGDETPTALAYDNTHNLLYIADETQEAIYSVNIGNGSTSGSKLTTTTYHPVGLAVDAGGDIFFADTSNAIYEIPYGTTTVTSYLSIATDNTYKFEFSAATELPIGMGFDASGNLYVMDSGPTYSVTKNDHTTTTNTPHLFEISSPTIWYLVPFSNVVNTGDTLTTAGIAVSSAGNILLADDSNAAVDELFYNNPVNFGSVHAGTTTSLVTANFQFNSTVTTPKVYQSVQGDYTSEFATGTPSCLTDDGTTGSAGTAGDICSFTFDATYLSTTPGLRMGAVGYIDGSNDTYAVRANGIDVAASMALYPGTQYSLSGETWTEPQGLAVTGDGGTLFVADEGGLLSDGSYAYNGTMWAVTNAATASPTYTKLNSYTTSPTPMAVAVDAAGNLYVADYGGKIYVYQPTYSNSGTPTLSWNGNYAKSLTLTGVTLQHPMALAIDPSGNLFIGDMGQAGSVATASNPGFIVEVPAGPLVCGTQTCVIGGASPFQLTNTSISGVPIVFPQALTTDLSGDLYIADGGDGDTDAGGVDVIPATVATGTAQQLSLGTLNQPSGLSFDAAGDLYILISYTPQILVAQMSGPATIGATVDLGTTTEGAGSSGITSTLVTPSNLVVWPGGENITIADIGVQQTGTTTVPAQVLTLSGALSTVNVNSGSASVWGVNVGNTDAVFGDVKQTGNGNFSMSGCASGSGSGAGKTLAEGIENTCTATISYSGSGAASATFTLNGTTGSDYSALSNKIIANATVTTPVATLTAPDFSFSQTNTATLTNSGTVALTINEITVTPTNSTRYLGGTCPYPSGTLAAGASCTIIFYIDNYFSTGTVTVIDNSGGVPGSTQTASTFYLFSFSLVTPAGSTGLTKPTAEVQKVGLPNQALNNTVDHSSSTLKPGDSATSSNLVKSSGKTATSNSTAKPSDNDTVKPSSDEPVKPTDDRF